MRPLRRPWLWLGVWIAMLVAVVVLSLVPPPDLQVPLPDNADKVEHLLAYAALAFAGLQLFGSRAALVWMAIGLVTLGVGLEIAQGALVPAVRRMDWLDAVANTLGVFLGMAPLRTQLATLLLRRGG
jgi:VanZ family protein